MDKKTALLVLQLEKNYTHEDIKKQYRKLSKIFHPDMPTGSKSHFELLTDSKDFLLSIKEDKTTVQRKKSNNYENINKKYDSLRYRCKDSLLNIVDLWK